MPHNTTFKLTNEARKIYDAVKESTNINMSKEVSEMIIAKYGSETEYMKDIIQHKKNEVRILENISNNKKTTKRYDKFTHQEQLYIVNRIQPFMNIPSMKKELLAAFKRLYGKELTDEDIWDCGLEEAL